MAKEQEPQAPSSYASTPDQRPVKSTPVSYAEEEEEYDNFALQDGYTDDFGSLAGAKPLTEFEKMS